LGAIEWRDLRNNLTAAFTRTRTAQEVVAATAEGAKRQMRPKGQRKSALDKREGSANPGYMYVLIKLVLQ
jgi:hypothetical protein